MGDGEGSVLAWSSLLNSAHDTASCRGAAARLSSGRVPPAACGQPHTLV